MISRLLLFLSGLVVTLPGSRLAFGQEVYDVYAASPLPPGFPVYREARGAYEVPAGGPIHYDVYGPYAASPRAPRVPTYPAATGPYGVPGQTPIQAAPPEPAPALPQAPAERAEAPADEAVVMVVAEPPKRLWKGNVELGLDGSEGNSQRFNLRFGVDAKRKTDQDVLSLDLDYHKHQSHSEETAHRAFLDWKYEWLFQDSPWTWFGHGTVDYDEFKAFDVRVSIDAGLGYQFIETDATTLVGRCGGGWSREIGGPDDEYVPEAVFGLDFERQLTKRQKLTATVDYMPDVTDFSDFRLRVKSAWEVLLDAEMNLSLKLSVLDRYDSTPHDAKPNDVDYAATLLWSF
jgi:putative salt-induced outer membrane protein YdiY